VDYQVTPYESPLTWPESVCGRVWWVAMLPASILFFLTIPDCRRPGLWQRMFFVTFAMAFLWIGGLSYLLVWMVTVAGELGGIGGRREGKRGMVEGELWQRLRWRSYE
jgi:hypothetical protein